jgi:hypothetical protein
METDRVRCIDDRVARAKTKVESLSGNNGNAIQVYASSKYPVPNGTLAVLCAELLRGAETATYELPQGT